MKPTILKNKNERREKGKHKFKKRIENYGLQNSLSNLFSLKTTGKPCSCVMCSPSKIGEKAKYKNL